MKCKIAKIMNAAIVIHLLILMDFVVSFLEISIVFNSDSADDFTIECVMAAIHVIVIVICPKT